MGKQTRQERAELLRLLVVDFLAERGAPLRFAARALLLFLILQHLRRELCGLLRLRGVFPRLRRLARALLLFRLARGVLAPALFLALALLGLERRLLRLGFAVVIAHAHLCRRRAQPQKPGLGALEHLDGDLVAIHREPRERGVDGGFLGFAGYVNILCHRNAYSFSSYRSGSYARPLA